MEFIVTNLIYFVGVFGVVLLIYFLLVNRKLKKKTNNTNISIEVNYLIKKFKLDTKKNKIETLMWIVTLINSFIIAFTSVVIFNIEGFIWRILVGFVLLMILIYSLYEIAGKTLKRKEEKK